MSNYYPELRAIAAAMRPLAQLANAVLEGRVSLAIEPDPNLLDRVPRYTIQVAPVDAAAPIVTPSSGGTE